MGTGWTQSTQSPPSEQNGPIPLASRGPLLHRLAGELSDPADPAPELLALSEADEVAQVCREYGLRTSLERGLAAILVRNLRAAEEYADQERRRRAGGIWIEQRSELIRAAQELRLRAERGAVQAAQALLSCRLQPTVNILAAKVAINAGGRA